jgi:uncharacterized membrane protein
MGVLVFFIALVQALWFVAAPLFEIVISVALVTPVLSLVTSRVLLLVGIDLSGSAGQPLLFGLTLLLTTLVAYALFGARKESRPYQDLYPFCVLAVVFSIAFYLSSFWWPDFVALGERLRDYSLVVSASLNPIEAIEPWMAGTPLNYYVYWYRFGAMLRALLGLELWTVYHALVALSIALYSAVCFQIVRVVLHGGAFAASLSAALIAFGSNVMGMLLLTRTEDGGWQSDESWWGASRVVRGAITEFPAWSFILGDAHPHYLNLVAIPFLFLLLYRASTFAGSPAQRAIYSGAVVALGILFLAGSNAWEVPMWLGLAVVTLALVVIQEIRGGAAFKDLKNISAKQLAGRLVAWMMLMAALRLNSSHIKADVGSLDYVTDPIAVTTTLELVAHWGAHILCFMIGLVMLLPRGVSSSSLLLLLLAAFAYSQAAVVMFMLLAGYLYCATRPATDGIRRGADGSNCIAGKTRAALNPFSYALIVAGLTLIIIPEVVFLNDPYGGDNERMNTIFKIYTAAWGMLGLGATAVLLDLAVQRRSQLTLANFSCIMLLVIAIGGFIVGSLRFNYDVAKKRIMPESYEYGREGLGKIDAEKPGAGALIRRLRALPLGTVLEGQGNPYSYATVVSTLAGQPAYLGWENHLNLLSQVKGEVARRSEVVQKIYGNISCSERLNLAREEGIRYLIWGASERQKYPSSSETSFACFEKVAHEQDFLLFEVH